MLQLRYVYFVGGDEEVKNIRSKPIQYKALLEITDKKPLGYSPVIVILWNRLILHLLNEIVS